MRLRRSFTRRAQAQISGAARSWHESNGNPHLFRREVTEALALITRFPGAGQLAGDGLHRVLLRRPQYMIYYKVNREDRMVTIVAVWHPSRGSGPPL